jgi:hypothetical protein
LAGGWLLLLLLLLAGWYGQPKLALAKGLNMHTSAIQKHAPSWPAASELSRSSGSIAR